jgi:hypothetical protein
MPLGVDIAKTLSHISMLLQEKLQLWLNLLKLTVQFIRVFAVTSKFRVIQLWNILMLEFQKSTILEELKKI